MAPLGILFVMTTLFAFLQRARPDVAGHQAFLFGFNLVFISIVMPVPAMGYLALFILFTYALSIAGCTWRAWHPAVFVVPAIIVFCILKRYEMLPLQPLYAHIPEILGLSYIIFRTLNVI